MSQTISDRFDIGRVLTRMTGVVSRNLVVFAGLALLLSGLPGLLVSLSLQGALSTAGAFRGLNFFPGLVIGIITSTLLQASLIHATVNDLTGRRVDFGECLGTAIRHVLPLIGIGVCAGIAAFFGMLLLIVPGVIIALALSVAAPARVVENLGVFASLSRSVELTRNHRGALFLLFLIYFVAILIGELVIGVLGFVANLASFGLISLGPVINALVQAVVGLLSSAGAASVYFELRTVKEGVSVEALAAAFD